MRGLKLMMGLLFLTKVSISQTGKPEEVFSGKGMKVREIGSLLRESKNKLIPEVQVRNARGAIWNGNEHPQDVVVPLDSSSRFLDPEKQKGFEVQEATRNSTDNLLVSGSVETQFEGISYSNVNPPDPTLAVGPSHIIQMLNGQSGSIFRITNRNGEELIPATNLDQVTGIGGFADPIAMYDHLANRFIMMEMANAAETGSYGISMAISQTGDPTGAWTAYFFSTGNSLPDYPKLALWPDALYITANEFTNATNFAGSFAYAINRNALLTNQVSPQMVRVHLGVLSKHISACPVTLQGSPPPSGLGSSGLIAYMQDDTWTPWDATGADSIGILKMDVNWLVPANSRVVTMASLSVSSFKSNVCTAPRGRCISQPGTDIFLESIHQKVMNQPVYRYFGNGEGIVLAHTTDAGNELSGIRWYELKRNSNQANWQVEQESTYAPDNTHRFMPSISYNSRGDIALAYNISGTGVFPGIRITGRKYCDSLSRMTLPEMTVATGLNYSLSARFGDYNHLVADPLNESFWVTGEYMPSFTWSTKIAQFQIDSCVQLCESPSDLVVSSILPNQVTAFWNSKSGITGNEVFIKLQSDTIWTLAGTTVLDSLVISNLLPSSNYQIRLRSICANGPGSWVESQFATPSLPCNPPDNLQTVNVTSTGGQVSWSPVSGALFYKVEYRMAGQGSWVIASNAMTDTVLNLNQLLPFTDYNWRVSSQCNLNMSDWSYGMITTLPAECLAPDNLQSQDITAGSALLTWTKDQNSFNTKLEYRKTGNTNWTVLFSSDSASSFFLSGLSSNSQYEWRVAGICSQSVSPYSIAQFSTTASCSMPSGLSEANITSNSVDIIWSKVRNSLGYLFEYKKQDENNWNSVLISNGSTVLYNVAGLESETEYVWRIRNRCSGGYSEPTDSRTFTTYGPACLDIYEPNESRQTAKPITVGSDIFGSIEKGSDLDWYTFSNTVSNPNIRVDLTQLSANYSLKLYNSSGKSVANGITGANFDKYIIYNTNRIETYYLQVFGSSSLFNPYACYKLNVQVQSVNINAIENSLIVNRPMERIEKGEALVYPNPVRDQLFVWYTHVDGGNAQAVVYDQTGRPVLNKQIPWSASPTGMAMDVRHLSGGMYSLVIRQNLNTVVKKFMVIR